MSTNMVPSRPPRHTAVHRRLAAPGAVALLLLLAPAPSDAASWQIDGGDAERAVRPEPIEHIADDALADAAWLAVASAADLYSTSWMLRSCSTCVEANPLGQDAEARLALKAGTYPLTLGACYVLRRTGHRNWATGLRWALSGFQFLLAARNACLAVRDGKGCLW